MKFRLKYSKNFHFHEVFKAQKCPQNQTFWIPRFWHLWCLSWRGQSVFDLRIIHKAIRSLTSCVNTNYCKFQANEFAYDFYSMLFSFKKDSNVKLESFILWNKLFRKHSFEYAILFINQTIFIQIRINCHSFCFKIESKYYCFVLI